MTGFSVFQSFIMCCKAPWEGMIFCCAWTYLSFHMGSRVPILNALTPNVLTFRHHLDDIKYITFINQRFGMKEMHGWWKWLFLYTSFVFHLLHGHQSLIHLKYEVNEYLSMQQRNCMRK